MCPLARELSGENLVTPPTYKVVTSDGSLQTRYIICSGTSNVKKPRKINKNGSLTKPLLASYSLGCASSVTVEMQASLMTLVPNN